MAESPRDPLPVILLALTVVSGIVDAISFLGFEHTFVANMTGNLVFLAFSLAGVAGISAAGSLVALAAFLAGAGVAGRLDTALASTRERLLAVAVTAEAALFCVGAVIAALWPGGFVQGPGFVVIVCLGIAMGIQNGVARKLAVPDLTTSVLTMTMTGIAADSSLAGGKNPRLGRRLTAVASLLAGAAAGAFLVLHVRPLAALVLATVLLVAATAGAWSIARGAGPRSA